MDKGNINKLIDLTMKMSDKCYALFENGELTSDYQRISNELLLVKARLNKPELYILIGGEAKVGKSTFVNCLIGEKVCPSSDEICTNVPSMIRYAEKEKIVVHFKANEKGETPTELLISRDQIPEYSTEIQNKKNKESVDYLEICINSPILAKGLVFIDSPGLGALDPRHAVATFEMASRADMILFLGNTDKELSSFEIGSLKQLIECSKCGYVAHVLTCCDRGDSDAIKIANIKTIKENFDKEIRTICVSSILFEKYLSNNKEAYLKKSGFDDIFSFIDYVGSIQEEILCSICKYELSIKVNQLLSKVRSIKETTEDPIKLEQRLNELETCKKRLIELTNKSTGWKMTFEKKQLDFQKEISDFIEEKESKMSESVDSLLEDNDYYNSNEKLTSALQSKLTAFKNELSDEIRKGMLEIYQSVKRETGFSSIQECVQTPGIDVSNMVIPKDCGEISKFTTVRTYLSNVMLGGSIGATLAIPTVSSALGLTTVSSALGLTGVSAKIGAMIGSVAPGLGNLVGLVGGALLGGLIALIFSVFQSKETKKKRKAAECKKHLLTFFSEVKKTVVKTLTDNKYLLTTQFAQELSDQQKECADKIKMIQPMAVTARAHWDTVIEIFNTLKSLDNNLSKK